MWYRFLVTVSTLLFIGCSVPSLDFLPGGSTISPLSLPVSDHGYRHLHTSVITTQKDFQSLLNTIDAQEGWDHKVAFGIKIGKASINFRKQNLLIYRYTSTSSAFTADSKIRASKETNTTVWIEEKPSTGTNPTAHAFFYTVSKSVKKVHFQSIGGEEAVENIQSKVAAPPPSAIPKKCIAWFDGCNHCIRSSTGKPLCTKRHCKQKGDYRCMKWQ